MMKKLLIFLIVLSAVDLIAVRGASASEFVVTNTTDADSSTCAPSPMPGAEPPVGAGACSLRQAINSANANPGPDVIRFNIPPSDPNFNGSWWTIRLGPTPVGPGVGLPTIAEALLIDGFSQPGTLGTFTTGTPGTTGACGVLAFERPNVAIDANKASIPSPTFPGLTGDVMSISGAASDVTIRGLSIYDSFGDTAFSLGNGVAAHAGPGTNRTVEAMFLGVMPDGSDPALPPNDPTERNFGFGVQQYSETDGNIGGQLKVTGSFVGFNGLTGINGQRDQSIMIATFNESFENGWNSDSQDGIDINGILGLVQCNLSHNNTALIMNGGGGAGVELGSQTAGGPVLDGNIVRDNSVYDNLDSGISIRKGADGNLIESNSIHDNLVGISVNVEARPPTNRNRFNRNSTFRNTMLGIDLELTQSMSGEPWLIMPDGVTPNDGCGDPDGGADGSPSNTASNDLQNFPDLLTAELLGSQIRIRGTFASVTGFTYVLQFFATPAADTSGFDREGKFFIGELMLFHDVCPQTFETTFTPVGPVSEGDQITVTATRFTTSSEFWSTSEYGGPVFVNQLVPEGKVTGGGFVQPPAPTCTAPCTPSSDTRANFGFVAQYKNQTDFTPQGHLNFVWHPGNVHLSSLDYTFASLVVHRDPTGNGDARWRGNAKVNNKRGFCFETFVQDMGEPGRLDTFHIRIWSNPAAATSADACNTDGPVVYDNNANSLLGGGNIQIHKP